jgi:arginine repressor
MLIQKNPNIYLGEIKRKLAEEMHTFVSPSTISRAMERIGFTRKTVSTDYFYMSLIFILTMRDHR